MKRLPCKLKKLNVMGELIPFVGWFGLLKTRSEEVKKILTG